MTVYQQSKTGNLRILYHPTANKELAVEYADSSHFNLDEFNLFHLSSEVNIQYLTDSIWFLYGTRTEYADYPFILKSNDAGKVWHFVFRRELNEPDVQLRKKSFFMFDELHGIWITGRGRSSIRYRITQDGGKSWKKKRIHYRWKRDQTKYQERFISSFSKPGLAEINIFRRVFLNGTIVDNSFPLQFQSTDQGESFRRRRL